MKIKYLILLLIFLVTCGNKQDEDVLAEVGGKKIYVQEFINRLEFSPRPLLKDKTIPEMNRSYLELLIAEKLLAIKAESEEFDKDTEIKKMVRMIEDRAVIKELYRREIQDQISVTDEEIRFAFKKMNTELELKYFWSESRKEADKFEKVLKQGIRFETALERYFGAPIDSLNCKRKLKWGDFNNRIEEAAYKMKSGEISPVIETHMGSFILKLDKISEPGSLKEQDYLNKKSGIRKLLRIRKETELSIGYVKEYMESLNIILKGPVFARVAEELSDRVNFNSRSNKKTENLKVFSEEEIDGTRLTLRNILNEKIVEFNGGFWTVEEILERIKLYNYPLDKTSKRDFINSLNRTVKYIVRDDFLVKKGKDIGLHKNPEVINEVNMWTDYFLYSKYKGMAYSKNSDVKNILDELKNKVKIVINHEKLNGIRLSEINAVGVNPGWVVYLMVPPFPEF